MKSVLESPPRFCFGKAILVHHRFLYDLLLDLVLLLIVCAPQVRACIGFGLTLLLLITITTTTTAFQSTKPVGLSRRVFAQRSQTKVAFLNL